MSIARKTADSASPRPGLKLARAWYLLGLLMLLVVGALSLMPAPDVGVDDKLGHLITYFVLGAWFGLLAANRRVLSWSIVGLLGYGMLLELLQGMTSYRFAEWADVAANGGGILLGSLVYFTPMNRVLAFVDRKLARIGQ